MPICAFCGKPIGPLDTSTRFSYENASVTLCLACEPLARRLRSYDGTDSPALQKAADQLSSYLPGHGPMAEQVLKALLDHYHGFTALDKARLDTGRPQPWLPIFTTESLPGYRITASRGVVFTHDLGNPVYQEALAHHNRLNLEAPSDADYDFIYACMLSDLCKKAERINGNALVGLRLQPCRTMAHYMGARNPDNLINPIHDYQTVAYATVVLAEPMPRPFVG